MNTYQFSPVLEEQNLYAAGWVDGYNQGYGDALPIQIVKVSPNPAKEPYPYFCGYLEGYRMGKCDKEREPQD